LGPDDLLHSDPAEALTLLQGAWSDLAIAREAQVDPQTIAQLDGQLRLGLDTLYATTTVSATQIYTAPEGIGVSALVQGPDNAAYAIVGDTVVRVDPDTGAAAPVIQAGDGLVGSIGVPRLLAHGGPDLLVVDEDGALWRWRPSGALSQVRLAGEQTWDETVVDLQTFVINLDQGLYRIYLPYPKTSQILRYDPTADGGGFSPPAPYFISESVDVARFRQLYVDGDIYAVTSEDLEQYFNGRQTAFSLDLPPDDNDLRAGHDYALLSATGVRGDGDLYVWDKLWSRVLVYDKAAGEYSTQYLAADGTLLLADLTGMYIVDRGHALPPLLIFSTASGLFRVELGAAVPKPSPTPAASASPSTLLTPGASESPTGPTPEPTERPRRTPRVTESPAP
jgi:hypothetical protein